MASPSSIKAFNTFLYTPELHINIHPYTTAAPAFPSDFNSTFQIPRTLVATFRSVSHLIPPLNHLCDNFFTESTHLALRHTSEHAKNCTSVNFLVGFSHLFRSLFSLWQPYFWCASEKRERSQRGGSKSAKPEAGRALMECLRAGEGKAVIRI